MVGNYTFFSSKEIQKSDLVFSGKAAVPLCVVKWLVCFRTSLQKHCLEAEKVKGGSLITELRCLWRQVRCLRESAHSAPATLGNIQ